ncbi:MAG: hypothetical protein M3153_09590 [Chloroflexota bacterium]|nr:hypothetical protein [Chloroflexota bacterium]
MRWLRGPERTADGANGLDPIRIVTAEIELSGFVAPAGQRVTDMLLRGQDLAFLPAGAAVAPEHWVSVSPTDILFVVPPPLPQAAGWQKDHMLHRVHVQLPGYDVTGTAHLDAGYEPGSDLTGRQSFLPMTSVEIARDGAVTEALDVVIVNLGRAARAQVIG